MASKQEIEVLDVLEDLDENVQSAKDITDCDMLKTRINIKQKVINLIHLNIRSIRKNGDELLAFVQTFELDYCDIMILTECYKMDCNTFCFPGYNSHYNHADFNKNDGTLILTKEYLNVQIKDYKLSSLVTVSRLEFNIEALNVGVNCLYRPTPTSALQFVQDIDGYFEELLKHQIEIFVGDLNLNINNRDDRVINLYLLTLSHHGFVSLVNCATRETSTSATCIDHLFMRKKLKTNSLKYQSFVLNNGLTDHYPIMLNLYNDSPNQAINSSNKNKPIRKEIIKTNYKRLRALLDEKEWDSVTSCKDPQKATDNFYKIVLNNIEETKTINVVKTCEHKKIKPWITNGIITAIKHRNKF
ncbi:unnamed protein product [Ceutorhynchus assimilis]|uniref:Endonuclease/exonuclease/phosphatase domain-containing protein n=1 Tax=Ceutorhynchus assimilis TaxID=467358 RepID=A0A9N9QIV1_9CUCU|nr:unnamed protein product [Ceutorhynchus assimilis]